MNAWDYFTYAMFAVLLAPLIAFLYLHWRDERRRKAAPTVHVDLHADTAAFEEAMRKAAEAVGRMSPSFIAFGTAARKAAGSFDQLGAIAQDVRRERRRLWLKGVGECILLGVIVGACIIAFVYAVWRFWL